LLQVVQELQIGGTKAVPDQFDAYCCGPATSPARTPVATVKRFPPKGD
jgi:hypothetical protein